MKYSYFYFTARGRRCQWDPLEGDGGFYSNSIPFITPIFSDVFILMKYSYFYFTTRGRRCQWDPLEDDGGFYSNVIPFIPHIFSVVFILMRYSNFCFVSPVVSPRARRCQWDPLGGDGEFYSNAIHLKPHIFLICLYWRSILIFISLLEGVDASGIRVYVSEQILQMYGHAVLPWNPGLHDPISTPP